MDNIQGTVSWGIIGCGDVCEVKSGPAFNKVPNSRLAAVMRRNSTKAADFAARHKVPLYFSDAHELINHPDVNAIYIATPPSSHEYYVEEALKAGKPVYVEKPVSLDASSCGRMVQTARKLNGKVSVAHYRRGLALFQKVKSLINDGAIGQVRVIQISVLQPPSSKIITKTEDHWRVKPEVSGGGLFNDLSPHQLDIMYWIFGHPLHVQGQSLNQSRAYNAPDASTLQVIFKNDILLNGVWAFNVSEGATEDRCEIIGDKGKLRFSFFKVSTLEVISGNTSEVLEPEYPENIQKPMIDSVTRFFRGEGPNPCSLEDALVVMQMIDTTHGR